MSTQEHKIYSVYLGNDYNKIKVSKVGYNQILEIVKATVVCAGCGQHYDEESPNVAGLLCLRCFLQQHRTFTFIGPLDPSLPYEQRYTSPDDPFEILAYLFLDKKGHAHVTKAGPGQSESASPQSAVTLAYWHFPRPLEAEWKGEILNTNGYSWDIYGDLMHDEVVILQHGSAWRKDEILFMAVRHGQAIQISRRRPMDRQILAGARAELEDTRNEEGHYWIDGEWKSYFQDCDVYRLAAHWLSEELKADRATRQPPEQAAEPEPVTE